MLSWLQQYIVLVFASWSKQCRDEECIENLGQFDGHLFKFSRRLCMLSKFGGWLTWSHHLSRGIEPLVAWLVGAHNRGILQGQIVRGSDSEYAWWITFVIGNMSMEHESDTCHDCALKACSWNGTEEHLPYLDGWRYVGFSHFNVKVFIELKGLCEEMLVKEVSHRLPFHCLSRVEGHPVLGQEHGLFDQPGVQIARLRHESPHGVDHEENIDG